MDAQTCAMTATASATPYIATVCLRSLPYTPPLLWLLCLVPACLPACPPARLPACSAPSRGCSCCRAARRRAKCSTSACRGWRRARCARWTSRSALSSMHSMAQRVAHHRAGLQHSAAPAAACCCAAIMCAHMCCFSQARSCAFINRGDPAPCPPAPLPIGPPAPLLPGRSCMPAQTTASPAPASGCTSCWAMPRASSSQ